MMTATFELNTNPTRRQWDDSARRNVHVRQNLANTDRPADYVPPHHSSSQDIGTILSSDERISVSPMLRDDAISKNDEMPFDLLNEVHQGRDPEPGMRVHGIENISSLDRSNDFQSVWESSPERMKQRDFKSHSLQPHFSIRGPRYSDPSVMLKTRDGNQDGSLDVNSCDKRKPFGLDMDASIYQEISVQPLTKDEEKNPDYHQGGNDEESRLHDKRSSNETANEVDVQFPEKGRKLVKVRRRSPSHFLELSGAEADDTSQESAEYKRRSPNTLQERTQQAWKWRQKKNSSLRSPNRDTEVPRASNNVSFQGADTVQYFDPHVDEATDETAVSIDEKSIKSDYTKTLESEVEDMIKDIFFIGSGKSSQPGRRKYKCKNEVKQRLRENGPAERNGSDDDVVVTSMVRGSITTAEPEVKNATEKPSPKLASKKATPKQPPGTTSGKKPIKRRETSTPKKTLNDLSETEAALWGFVDSGFAAVSSALGLVPDETDTSNPPFQSNAQVSNDLCSDPMLPFEACPGTATPVKVLEKRGTTEMFDSAQDMMYGQYRDTIEASEKSSSHESSAGSRKSLPLNREIQSDSSKESTEGKKCLPFLLDRIDEDPRMEQLALHAAKSLHRTQGIEFDDSYPISLHEDVEISVVELKLPLGLIFLENEGGCFVTSVAPGGSAARSGGVQIGDQLAAINGESFARMKVDDICEMIARYSTKISVELVFLRYIGAFRPSRIPERVGMNEPSFDLDMTHCVVSSESFESQPISQPVKDLEKKRGFRMFGLGKKRDSSKK